MLGNKSSCLFILIFFLSSCEIFGSTYDKPNVNIPEAWNSRDSLSVNESTDLAQMAWWKKFDDPQLSYLIESALQNNNNVQAAIGNVEAAQGQLKQIQYSWIPNLAVDAGYTNTSNNFLNPGYGIAILPNYTLNLMQLIKSTEYAKANLSAVRAAKDAVRLTVISQTSGGYFAYLGQDYLLTLQKQLVNNLAELLRLKTIQYQKGLISLYTLQQCEQQYEQAEVQIPILQNNVVAAGNTLKVLLNENPGGIKRGIAFMDIKSDGIIPANLPSEVLRNRPDVRQSEQQLIAANAAIGIAKSTFFPTISLTAGGGYASNELNQLVAPGNSFWNQDIDVNMPLLSFSTYGQIQQAKGAYHAVYAAYMQTVRQAFASVDNDLSAHDKYYKSLGKQFKNYASL